MRTKVKDEANVIRQAILRTAEDLTRKRGFNSFSYKDVAGAVGIKTSSIHYYFPQKNDLALALVERYRDSLLRALDGVTGQGLSVAEQLREIGELFIQVSQQNEKLCLCGILSAELYSVSDDVKLLVSEFFFQLEQTLARILRQGMDPGAIEDDSVPEYRARLLMAVVEGGMLIARTRAEQEYFPALIRRVIQEITPGEARG